jgi:hypothetical protein
VRWKILSESMSRRRLVSRSQQLVMTRRRDVAAAASKLWQEVGRVE